MRVRAISVTSAVAAIALLCGCGSSSNTTSTFKAGYNTLRGELNQTGAAIAAELNQASKQTDAQVEMAFRTLASRFQGQLSKLETLKPPSNIAVDWNSVTAAASRLESDLNAIAAAAATHSASAAKQAGASLAVDAQALQTAAAPVKSKLGLK